MSRYLQRHDLVYEAAPLRWDEGLPLANGPMGAMIWGDGAPLRLTMDAAALWDLRSTALDAPWYDYANFRKLHKQGRIAEAQTKFKKFREQNICPTRLPGPRLEINFGQTPEKFQARLGLAAATAKGRIQLQNGKVDWEAWIPPGLDVLVLRVRPGEHPKGRIRARLDHFSARARADLKQRSFRPHETGRSDGCSWLYQGIPKNGGYLLAWRRIPQTNNGETILISISQGKGKQQLLAELSARLKDAALGLQGVRRKHTAWWRNYWSKSFLTIPDQQLERLYYAEMYKFGASTGNPDLPAALQGVWSPDGEMPNWQGDYHLDLDIELSYWPAYTSNHLECAGPLYEWGNRLLPRLEAECKRFFKCEGAFWRCALGPNGEPVYGYLSTEHCPGNGAWFAYQYWQRFRYSQDEDFLRDHAWPMLRASMLLYENLLEEGKDGRYHLPLSSSPEYGENSPHAWGADTAYDLALIRFLAEALLESIERLRLDEPHADKWRDILNRLAPLPTAATMTPAARKQIADAMRKLDYMRAEECSCSCQPIPDALFVMQDAPYAFSHRHLSHLLSIYPVGQLDIDGSEQERKTILDSIQSVWLQGQGGWVGFTFSWAAVLGARAGLPAFAWRMLTEYAGHFVGPNSFHLMGDYRKSGASSITFRTMILQAGFAAAAAIMEMLLQSRGGTIRVFPAVPPEWKDVAFCDLRAEGAFLVSATRQDHKLQWLEIRSERGMPCRLVNPFPGDEVTVEEVESQEKERTCGRLLSFPTRSNCTYRVYCSREMP